MKKTIRIMSVIAAVFGLVSIWTPACSAAGPDQKIGTVNLQKVFDKYYKTVRSNLALQQEAADMEKERNAMVDAAKKVESDWKKLMEKSEDQVVSAEERARSKKAAQEKYNEVKAAEQSIDEYDRSAGTKLREKRRQRTDDILKEIRAVLDVDAKTGGYALVLDVSGESANMAPVVLYSNGACDLTDTLIKELNVGAPITPDEEKDAKPAKGAK